MNTHKFKIVELSSSAQSVISYFNYRYVEKRDMRILKSALRRFTNEIKHKNLPNDITISIVEGERENGYLNQHATEPYFYREDKREVITLEELIALFAR